MSGLALLAIALCLRSASAYICHEADRQFHGCGGRAPAGGAPGDTPWDGERVRWLTPRPRWTRWPPLLPRRGSRRTTRSTPRRTDLWRRPPHTSSSQTRAASLWGDVSPHPAAARPSSGFPEASARAARCLRLCHDEAAVWATTEGGCCLPWCPREDRPVRRRPLAPRDNGAGVRRGRPCAPPSGGRERGGDRGVPGGTRKPRARRGGSGRCAGRRRRAGVSRPRRAGCAA